MKKKILLVGGFKRTKLLAASLIKKGYRVTAINGDAESCKKLEKINNKLNVIYGDGSRPYVLEEADAKNADIVIALSEFDENNLVTCELCKKIFNVKKTVAVISDPKKTDFFYHMGVDSVVCTVAAVAGIIEQQALLDEIKTKIPMVKTNVKVSQIPVTESAPCCEKKLWELNLPKDVIIGCIMRDDKTIIPHGSTGILAGDVLVLISTDENEQAALKELLGENE